MNSDMNTISHSELEEIWTPDLLFVNTKKSQRVNLKNESSIVAIEIIKGISFWEVLSFQFHLSWQIFSDDSAIKNPSNEIFNGFWHEGKDW